VFDKVNNPATFPPVEIFVEIDPTDSQMLGCLPVTSNEPRCSNPRNPLIVLDLPANTPWNELRLLNPTYFSCLPGFSTIATGRKL
jgi:hypothetical protein